MEISQALFHLLKCMSKCRQRLIVFKLSYMHLRLAFEEIDKEKKGYLIVQDIYNFLEKKIRQGELFYIMRELNYSKNGVIMLQDLFEVMGDDNNFYSNLRKRKPIEQFLEIINIMKSNYEQIERRKSQLGISVKDLQNFCMAIIEKNKTITVNSFIEHLFGKIDFDFSVIKEIKIIFRKCKTISLEQLCLAFEPNFIYQAKGVPNQQNYQLTEEKVKNDQREDQVSQKKILTEEIIRSQQKFNPEVKEKSQQDILREKRKIINNQLAEARYLRKKGPEFSFRTSKKNKEPSGEEIKFKQLNPPIVERRRTVIERAQWQVNEKIQYLEGQLRDYEKLNY